MSCFEVTAVELQLTGSALHELSTDTRASLSVLRADVESLLGGSWLGGAASGFRSGWDEWHAAAVDALGVLDEMGNLLHRCGRDYTASDDSGGLDLRRAAQGL